MKFKLLASLIIGTSVMASTAIAQQNYRYNDQSQINQRYDRSNSASDYVSIYEHCDFRGERRDVLVGQFNKMRAVNFANDSVSSIKIPNGMILDAYEDDNYRGDYVQFDQSVSCLDRRWNDKISSLKVSGLANDERNYRSQQSNRSEPRAANRGNNRNSSANANVNGKNIAKVVFSNKVLQQNGSKSWQMNSQRGGVSQFKEISRDSNTVYLQNDYTAEKIRIDLFANDVTIIAGNGKQQRYNIQNKVASLTNIQNNTRKPTSNTNQQVNRRIQKQCFNYQATSRGGDASIRFETRDSLNRFNNKTVTGKICHKGSLRMQIGKRDSKTDVTVFIEGNEYRFAPNETATSFENSWYRKDITLSVGR